MIKNIGGFTGGKNFKVPKKTVKKPKKDWPEGSTTGDVNGSYSPPQTKRTVKPKMLKKKTAKKVKGPIKPMKPPKK